MPNIAPFETQFAHDIYAARYKHPDDGCWAGTAKRVVGSVMPALYHAPKARSFVGDIEETSDRLFALTNARQFVPGGRYLYAAGRDLHQIANCILLRCGDSREAWASLSYKAEMSLMTGAGVGVYYGDVRPAGAPIGRTGGVAGGPIGKMMAVNDAGRYIAAAGSRRGALLAGLPWWHADVLDFISAKDWPLWLREKKAEDWNVQAPLDMTNISVALDDDFFAAYSNASGSLVTKHGETAPDGGSWHDWSVLVYDSALTQMLLAGEPGFTVDLGDQADEVCRNPCGEIVSAEDSDVCNLGSLVMPRFSTPKQFGRAVRDAVAFLTAGTIYSHVPYRGKDLPHSGLGVDDVRSANRRLGLGLCGVHEFIMSRGVRYGTDQAYEVMEPWMNEYARATEYAHDFQAAMGLSQSKGTRAIAPNGTIGIIAESTPSGDPLFSAAETRAVKSANMHGPDKYETHVVVDPVAARLVAAGVDTSLIEDAYSLSYEPDRRLGQQAFMQRYVDQAISSTLNLPAVVTDPREIADFGSTLMRFLPELRGVTAYPDGARAGQPRTSVDLNWALEQQAEMFTDANTCVGGTCGI